MRGRKNTTSVNDTLSLNDKVNHWQKDIDSQLKRIAAELEKSTIQQEIEQSKDQKDQLLKIATDIETRQTTITQKINNLSLVIQDTSLDSELSTEIEKLSHVDNEINANERELSEITARQIKLKEQNEVIEKEKEYLKNVLPLLETDSNIIPSELNFHELGKNMGCSNSDIAEWLAVQQAENMATNSVTSESSSSYLSVGVAAISGLVGYVTNRNNNNPIKKAPEETTKVTKNKKILINLIKERIDKASLSIEKNTQELASLGNQESQLEETKKELNAKKARLNELLNLMQLIKSSRVKNTSEVSKVTEKIKSLSLLGETVKTEIRKLEIIDEYHSRLTQFIQKINAIKVEQNKLKKMELEKYSSQITKCKNEIATLEAKFSEIKNQITQQFNDIIPAKLTQDLARVEQGIIFLCNNQEEVIKCKEERIKVLKEEKSHTNYQSSVHSYHQYINDEENISNIVSKFCKIIPELKLEEKSWEVIVETIKRIAELNHAISNLTGTDAILIKNHFENFFIGFIKNSKLSQSVVIETLKLLNQLNIRLDQQVLQIIHDKINYQQFNNLNSIINTLQICQNAHINIVSFVSDLVNNLDNYSPDLSHVQQILDICIKQGVSNTNQPSDHQVSVDVYNRLLKESDKLHIDDYLRKLSKRKNINDVRVALANLYQALKTNHNSYVLLDILGQTFKKLTDLAKTIDYRAKQANDISLILDAFNQLLSIYQSEAINTSNQHESLISILYSIDELGMIFSNDINVKIANLLNFNHVANVANLKTMCQQILICARVGLDIKESIHHISIQFVDVLDKHELAILLFACCLHDANSTHDKHISKSTIKILLDKTSALFSSELNTFKNQNEANASIITKTLCSSKTERYDNATLIIVKYYRFFLQAAYYYNYPLDANLDKYLNRFILSNDETTISDEQRYLFNYLEQKFSHNKDITIKLEASVIAGLSADMVVINRKTNKKYVVEYDGFGHFYKQPDFSLSTQQLREYAVRDGIVRNNNFGVFRFTKKDFGIRNGIKKENIQNVQNPFYVGYRVHEFIKLVNHRQPNNRYRQPVVNSKNKQNWSKGNNHIFNSRRSSTQPTQTITTTSTSSASVHTTTTCSMNAYAMSSDSASSVSDTDVPPAQPQPIPQQQVALDQSSQNFNDSNSGESDEYDDENTSSVSAYTTTMSSDAADSTNDNNSDASDDESYSESNSSASVSLASASSTSSTSSVNTDKTSDDLASSSSATYVPPSQYQLMPQLPFYQSVPNFNYYNSEVGNEEYYSNYNSELGDDEYCSNYYNPEVGNDEYSSNYYNSEVHTGWSANSVPSYNYGRASVPVFSAHAPQYPYPYQYPYPSQSYQYNPAGQVVPQNVIANQTNYYYQPNITYNIQYNVPSSSIPVVAAPASSQHTAYAPVTSLNQSQSGLFAPHRQAQPAQQAPSVKQQSFHIPSNMNNSNGS